jgi:GNAT superfamily N-acetyltransferase
MGLSIEIRDALPAEQEALDTLHRSSAFVWDEDRASLEAHPDALGIDPAAVAAGRVRVAVGGAGTVLGFAVTSPGDDAEACELEDLFVDPLVMRHGVGRALVEDAAARAQSAGYRRITVVADARNFPFYEQVGFVVVGSAETRFGPASRLARELPPRP